LSPGTVLGPVSMFALSVLFDNINRYHNTVHAIATSLVS
jgi:hypothetical protein